MNLNGLNISNVNYKQLLDYISDAVNNNLKKNISYANANTINYLFKDTNFINKLNEFDLVHPDGIGIYLASKLLFGDKGLKERITGSDFYPLLAAESVNYYRKIFFFGSDEKTLSKIESVYPELNICGYNGGYNFDNTKLLDKINTSAPNILIIGLGFPKQEKWILENCSKLNYNVCLAVGDGIRVFSKSSIRGPAIFRKIGLEWLVRLFTNPLKYWKRYLIGNPLFLYRILKLKMTKFVK